MPTAPTITTVSGNSFSVTVTPCELDIDITLRDFIILENGVLTLNPTSYNKTSATTIQYAGPSLPSTTLEVRRYTPRGQRQIAGVGITKISSDTWNKEFDRRVRIQEEIDTYGAGGGFSVRLPLDAAYGPGWNGDTLFSPTRNALYGVINTLAPLASPAFTGNPTVPTQLTSDNSTRVATTSYVKSNLTPYAPLASPTFTGNPTVPTPLTADNSVSIATTAYVKSNLASYALTSALSSYAPLASPAFTGTPTTPTFSDGVKTTQSVNALNLQRRSRPIVVASRISALTTVAGVNTDLVFDNEISDTSGTYNPVTGVFTAPYTGWYEWSCTVACLSDTQLVVFVCQTTGTELVRLGQQFAASPQILAGVGTQLVFMNSGDTRKVNVRTGGATTIFNESNVTIRSVCHMAIKYIGIDTAT
jgi:hypothetical protein